MEYNRGGAVLVVSHEEGDGALPVGEGDERTLLKGGAVLVLVEVMLLPELEQAQQVCEQWRAELDERLKHAW